MLHRFAVMQGYVTDGRAELDEFIDAAEVSEYAEQALAWAVSAGLINGFEDGTLRPHSNATRAQVAAIMMRFISNVH